MDVKEKVEGRSKDTEAGRKKAVDEAIALLETSREKMCGVVLVVFTADGRGISSGTSVAINTACIGPALEVLEEIKKSMRKQQT